MSLAILGIGTAVPATRMTQAEALELARAICCRTDEQATWLPALYGAGGPQTRHLAFSRELVDDIRHGTRQVPSVFQPRGGDDQGPTCGQRMRHYAEWAPPLALEAARQALHHAGLASAAITHLVTVSCTGFQAPGVDIALIKGLKLPATVERTQVGFMGCHGSVNGLRVARALATADPNARVLLCAVELCSVHYHYDWDPQQMVANALFADGAAALVGVNGAESSEPWQVSATGSCLIPDSEADMGWSIGDHHFEMKLSKRIPGLIGRHLRPWLESWLAEHQLAVNEIGSWAIHPGGPRILSAVEECLGLTAQQAAASRAVFAEYGNMSSPTLLFILDRLRKQRARRPCVLLGFGPGMIAEAALLDRPTAAQ